MNIKETTLNISGMHCVSCSVTIEKALKSIKGVQEAQVSFAQEQASIKHDPKICTVERLQEEIRSLGYESSIFEISAADIAKLEKEKEILQLRNYVIISIALTIPVVLGTMVPHVPSWLQNPWLHWVLATPIQFWINRRFYASAWRSFLRHTANMYTLIVLGTTVAYSYSVILLFFEDYFKKAGISVHSQFESAMVIITFILLGQYLETKAKGAASQAIRELMALQPAMATVFKTENGKEAWKDIPVSEVQVDDIILIKPGDTIPVDGVITQGESYVDQHMVTGESVSVPKKVGDTVIGATINKSGSFQMRASKVGSETLLAKIIDLVQKAQRSKAPIQKLVDVISSIFVPGIIVFSLCTFLIWFNVGPEPRFLYAIVSMVAVLIIACPCALGLATPTSMMVGIGRGAREGILIKDAQTLEVAGNVTTMVLDKTGTLTAGKPRVINVAFLPDLEVLRTVQLFEEANQEEAQKLAISFLVSLEKLSRHPVSQAIIDKFGTSFASFDVEQFTTLEGLGIKGTIKGQAILVGTRALLEQEKVQVNPFLEKYAREWSSEAQTVSLLAINNTAVMVFSVADPLRTVSLSVITKLKNLNIEPVMLTGDNPDVARAVADKLGIQTFYAQVLPQDKEKFVRECKKRGGIVGMVGDGINDAPALAAADVGIAMGEGTAVAIETAGVTLLKSDITLVPKVVNLSKAIMRNIKQNLIWAFGYNVILIPVAAGVLYPLFGITLHPMFAGIAMAFSSVSVVFNALRLKRAVL